METHIQQLLRLAGLAQIVLALASLAIPQVLKWRAELTKVQPLIKQMLWVHAAYIFAINLCLGLISLFNATELTNHTNLATIITAFIAVYWISRVLSQFFYFDRTNFPKGGWNTAAEVVLTILFILLSINYTWVTWFNFSHI